MNCTQYLLPEALGLPVMAMRLKPSLGVLPCICIWLWWDTPARSFYDWGCTLTQWDFEGSSRCLRMILSKPPWLSASSWTHSVCNLLSHLGTPQLPPFVTRAMVLRMRPQLNLQPSVSSWDTLTPSICDWGCALTQWDIEESGLFLRRILSRPPWLSGSGCVCLILAHPSSLRL